eukprot:TRINITY_DN13965_c0_g1_i1.p2 TRINITY_DN13965_c0_g1~~TRINITY_DN13965_c0_g1_i1.p2  ORF type:complete len:284 (+),score=93.21 TRINITY_DN13965_c0_g1_i1:1416-2267(+)
MRDIPRGSPASLFQDGSEEDVPDDERPLKRFAAGGRRNAPREFLDGDFATSGAAPSPYTAALPGARARLAPSNFANFRTAAGSPPPSLAARPLAPSPLSTVWRAPPVSSVSAGAGAGGSVMRPQLRRPPPQWRPAGRLRPRAVRPAGGVLVAAAAAAVAAAVPAGGRSRGKAVASPQPVLPGRRASPAPGGAGKASPQPGAIDKGVGHGGGDKGAFAGGAASEVLHSGGGASSRRPSSGGGGGGADAAVDDADAVPRSAPVAGSAGLPSGVAAAAAAVAAPPL